MAVNRERSIDINKLSIEQVDFLSAQIGDKIKLICDETAAKVNAILVVYGMEAKIAISIEEKAKPEPSEEQS